MNFTTKTPKIQTDLGMNDFKDAAEQATMVEDVHNSFKLEREGH